MRSTAKRDESSGIRGTFSPPKTKALSPMMESASEERWRGREGVIFVQEAAREDMVVRGDGAVLGLAVSKVVY